MQQAIKPHSAIEDDISVTSTVLNDDGCRRGFSDDMVEEEKSFEIKKREQPHKSMKDLP